MTTKFSFGDYVENANVPEGHARRRSVFIREGERLPGEVNHGRYFEFRCDDGTFWECSAWMTGLSRVGSIIEDGFEEQYYEAMLDAYNAWSRDEPLENGMRRIGEILGMEA
jgi:hypothetical protein